MPAEIVLLINMKSAATDVSISEIISLHTPEIRNADKFEKPYLLFMKKTIIDPTINKMAETRYDIV